jgi:glycosyltransferase involved in cell wall biosynthesis
MQLSVIICTYNREKFILDSLISIKNQSLTKDNYEIIIVNNNSTDRTDEICRKFVEDYCKELKIVYVNEVKQGLSFARNRGFQESKGDIIVYIDDDAFVTKDYLKNMIHFFTDIPNVSAIGGKVIPVYENNKEEPRWLSKYIWGIVTKVDMGNKVLEFSNRKYPAGCNMAIKRDVLQSVGLFDTNLGRKGRIGLASEEKDIFFRMRNANFHIYYVPNIPVYHNIDNHRLEYEYIKKLCIGIGLSERIRTQKISQTELFKKLVEYLLKYFAALGLSFIFLLKFQIQKAKYIILIRYLILEGFFKKDYKQ